ncbi:hypothetical protein B0J12DRAFT_327943 [Macrophomina phaseolina]|uniref:Zn(2)-C6 fungal-type domain-containing protein n=1 Tax=Macrophomina phaseolina TaxID=35725 RepID=A0ABQ8FVC0_9PEZI|nr:hypothetical protein B0J12DRAFT_327943 [Macrophomina phaseolina]
MFSVFTCSAGENQQPSLTCIEETSNHQPPRKTRNHLACQACRSRKLKCSGETGGCSRCSSKGVECVYVAQRASPRRRLMSPGSFSSPNCKRTTQTSSPLPSSSSLSSRTTPVPPPPPPSPPSHRDSPSAGEDGSRTPISFAYTPPGDEEETEPPPMTTLPPGDPTVDADLRDFLLGLDPLLPSEAVCQDDTFSPTAFEHEMDWVNTFDPPAISATFTNPPTYNSTVRDSLAGPSRSTHSLIPSHTSPSRSSSRTPSPPPNARCCSCIERSLAALDKLFSCPRKQSAQREAVEHTLSVLNHFTSHAWSVLDCDFCPQSRASMTLLVALAEKTHARFQQLAQSLARGIKRLGAAAGGPGGLQDGQSYAHEGLSVMSFRALLALKRFAAVQRQVMRCMAESPALFHHLACCSAMEPGIGDLLKQLKRAAEVD